jgi:hypothetical protein
MDTCPQCAHPTGSWADKSGPTICPACGTSLRPGTRSTWVDVARVTNLAEAGFLSDELNGIDIEARVHQAEDFSELSGGLTTNYLIRVPAEAAHEAASKIRAYTSEEAADGDAASTQFGFTAEPTAVDPVYWRPVAVIMLAGVASFVLGRQSAMPQPDRRISKDSLAAAVDAIGEPLVTESAADRPRHALTYDRRRQTWYLDTDSNGDGMFDTRRQFHTSGATW